MVLLLNAQNSAPPSSPAETPPTETIVVTGSYEPVPLGESDRSIDVLRTGPAEKLLSNTISDFFKLDSSVDLAQRAPGNAQGDLSIRGSTFEQTLILIDGMRWNDPQSAHHDLDIPIPLEAISQMEILHGGGSTMYGSDAVGGVVNIVTRSPEQWDARLRGALGSFGTNQERITAGGPFHGVSELLSISRDFSTGFTDDRDFRVLDLSSGTMFRDPLGPGSVWLAFTGRPFGAAEFYGAPDAWEHTKGWFASAHQMIGENTSAEFAFRRHTDLYVLDRDNPVEEGTNRHADETWQGILRRTDSLPLGAKLHYGVEADADSIVSNNLGDHSRTQEAVYASYDARVLKRFSLSAGLRDELYNGFRNELSPTVSGAAWLSSRLKLRANISRAFQLPTYTDLYYSDPYTLGNPDLKPEQAWNYEAGLDLFLSPKWQARFTGFERRDESVIDFVQYMTGGLYQAVNVFNLTFSGAESSLDFMPARTEHITLAYTYLHGNQAPTPGVVSRYVFNYPVHSGIVNWQGSLGRGFAFRTRVGVLQRFEQNPYAVWDAYFAWTRGRVHPFFQLTNLADVSYQEIPGVPEPGRAVIGGVEIGWRPTAP